MEDSKLAMYQNVLIRTINTETGESKEYNHSNRITKTALLGIVRFIYGDFGNTNHDQASQYIPKYLALGGWVSGGTSVEPENVGSVNATKLTNEITNKTISTGYTPRIEISSKTITNEIVNDYIKITMKMFVPSSALKNTVINEAGLFATVDGDSCWARVGLTDSPITKDSSTTIDIIWDVTIKSIATTTTANQ